MRAEFIADMTREWERIRHETTSAELLVRLGYVRESFGLFRHPGANYDIEIDLATRSAYRVHRDISLADGTVGDMSEPIAFPATREEIMTCDVLR